MRVKEEIQVISYVFHDTARTINVLVESSRVAKIGQKIIGNRMGVANGGKGTHQAQSIHEVLHLLVLEDVICYRIHAQYLFHSF
jgi:hypothetical protein